METYIETYFRNTLIGFKRKSDGVLIPLDITNLDFLKYLKDTKTDLTYGV